MSTWVIPYIDQDAAFWTELDARFGAHIKEVYFPLPGGVVGSGRSHQPNRMLNHFLNDAPFAKSVLVNPIILHRPVEDVSPAIITTLRELYELFGVDRVVVANLALARQIREALPAFHITASVLMGIAMPSQLPMVRDCVDTIVPDTRLVRDLAGLQRLRAAFDGELRLLVNEACLGGCLFRTQHFYEMGYSDQAPASLCQPLLDEQPWLRLTGAWILPRHINHYNGVYDSLKLAGRVTLQQPEKYTTVLQAYIHREPLLPCEIGGGPASVLAPIDLPDHLFEHILHCDKNCHTCSVCRTYYEQAIAQEQASG